MSLYLAISLATISVVLVREENGVQRPVYFTSRAFRGVKERYLLMEKLAFTLVTAACKLKPYFQAHAVIVLTDTPLRREMSSHETAGQMALWVIELSKFNV